MKLTLPGELSAGLHAPRSPFDEFGQRTGESILVAAIVFEPAQPDQIGSHFRPDFKAHDHITLSAALSGSPHADGGGDGAVISDPT